MLKVFFFLFFISLSTSLDFDSLLSNYTAAWSGHIDGYKCRDIADLYSNNARLYIPTVSSNTPIHGQRNIYKGCESQNLWLKKIKNKKSLYINRIDTFLSGFTKYFYSAESNELAFQRSILFLTNITNCRFLNHGITVLQLELNKELNNDTFDKEYLIRAQHDYYDFEEIAEQLENCSFPSDIDSNDSELSEEKKKELLDILMPDKDKNEL